MNDNNDNTKESKTDINGKSTVNKKPMDFQLCFIN